MENAYGARPFKYPIKRLIELVKQRPTIWDSSRADFKCFYNKEVAWLGVYEALDENYLSSDERTQGVIGMTITAKWRNIRDAFIRSVKKQAQDSRVKNYMHHDQLSFMLKLFKPEENGQTSSERLSWYSESTTENFTEDGLSADNDCTEGPFTTAIKTESEDVPTDYNDPYSPVMKIELEDESPIYFEEVHSNLKRKSIDFDDEHDEKTNSKVQRLETETEDHCSHTDCKSGVNAVKEVKNVQRLPSNEDEAFFESLLSLIKDMSSDEKLDFRMAVLQLIKETRLKRRMST